MSTQELRLAILHRIIRDYPAVGKTRLQKFGYLLQETLTVPTKYLFRMHHYGPYAESLETSISRLKLSGYVDIRFSPTGYGFEISAIDEPADEWERLLEPYAPIVKTVEDKFGRLMPAELELWTTLHFVEQLLGDAAAEEVINNVKALKPKFSEAHIAKVRTDLKEWLGAPKN